MATGRFAAFLRRFGNVPWRDITTEAFDRVLLVAKTACVVHVINNHVCSVAKSQGPSMLPTFSLTGDVIIMDMISARWGSIGVGDVVFLRSPEDPRKIITKRVMGLEGDSVTFVADPASDDDRTQTVQVPKGHVWVQGDNIYNSTDSRKFGPVPYGLIKAKAFCKVGNYVNAANKFGVDAAIQGRSRLSPVDWWQTFGTEHQELQQLAVRILSQNCSSSGCERNWSTFDQIYTRKRNRLKQKKLNDLVFVHYNLRLREKQLRSTLNYDPNGLDNFMLNDEIDEWVHGNEDEFEGEDLSWLDDGVGGRSSLMDHESEGGHENDEDDDDF